jgi:hypothetical protein
MTQKWELAALWSLAVIVITGSIFVAGISELFDVAGGVDHSQTHGIVIGGLMAALPMLINSIRNIGQSQAMQAMADQLGQSAPVTAQASGKADDPINVTEAP